jgi:hypothetical protein
MKKDRLLTLPLHALKKTDFFGILKMPNSSNHFQNKRTMSEVHKNKRDQRSKRLKKKSTISRKIRVVLYKTKKSQLFDWYELSNIGSCGWFCVPRAERHRGTPFSHVLWLPTWRHKSIPVLVTGRKEQCALDISVINNHVCLFSYSWQHYCPSAGYLNVR